jgi:ABC-2 type transport system ATP-binding protein
MALADRTAAIRTQALCKTYANQRGRVEAVRGIDLDIGRGEFFGLLGPNGAGKSTTIGMLTTLVVPSGGRAWVGGVDVAADPVAVKRRIGVVAQTNTLDRLLTAVENLEFRGRFFGMSGPAARRRANELIDHIGLGERRAALPMQLSGGQAKRLMIARALMHRPDILFLDEPTAGLDPQSRRQLWDTVRTLHAAGHTILLTTHYLEEAEQLCGRVAVIDHGRVLAQGPVEELKATTGAETVITVTYDGGAPPAVARVRDRAGVNKLEIGGERVRVYTRRPEGVLGELVAAGARAGRPVRDATTRAPSLETVFLTLTGRDYRE